MHQSNRSFIYAMVVLLPADRALAGPVWDEILNGAADAGKLTSTAQTTTGIGPLNGIHGFTSHPDDTEDVYQIKITDPVNFKAQTTVTTPFGSSFDTHLWLFDSAGLAILSNDNETGMATMDSLLASPANDVTGQTIPGPGIYYLAISGSGDAALSLGGPMFFFLAPDEISGPDGPGGLSPLIGWTGAGPTGEYLVLLTGATFAVPSPGGLLVLILGAMTRTRRRT